MFCSSCGAANPDGGDVRFCRVCGTELVLPSPSSLPVNPAPAGAPGGTGYGPPISLAAGGALAMGVPVPLAAAAIFPYAGFWIRLVAYVIDYIIQTVAVIVPAMAVGVALGIMSATGQVEPDEMASLATLIGGLLGFLIGIIYLVVLPPTIGATPGKLILGYHIVGQDGRHIGFGRALGRGLAQIVSALPVGLGYIWIGVDAYKQGWHDKIAGTYVIRKEFVKS